MKGFLFENKHDLSNNPSTDPAFTQALPSHIVDAMQFLRGVNNVSSETPKQSAAHRDHKELPDRIVFPYARHSSLPELRHLVQALQPKDVWPCTFDFVSWVRKGVTIQYLFGDCCSGDTFAHDSLMDQMRESQGQNDDDSDGPDDTQHTSSSHPIHSSPVLRSADTPESARTPREKGDIESPSKRAKRTYEAFIADDKPPSKIDGLDLQDDSQASILSDVAYETRLKAFKAAESMANGDGWSPIGLISTTDHHTLPEEDLGGK